MRTLIYGSIAILAAVAAMPLLAADETLPPADQVLDKYIAAVGGKDALVKITSRTSKGKIEVTTFGAHGTYQQYSKAPDRQITISDIEGYGSVIQCVEGNSGWISDPQAGLRDMSPGELNAYKRGADMQGALHLKARYKKLTVTGKQKVGGHEVYVLEGQPAEGPVEKMYFDTASGLMVETDIPTPQNQMVAVTLDDYRDVEGVKMPFSIKQDSSELALVITVEEMKNNVPVDDSKFAKPKQQ